MSSCLKCYSAAVLAYIQGCICINDTFTCFDAWILLVQNPKVTSQFNSFLYTFILFWGFVLVLFYMPLKSYKTILNSGYCYVALN